MARFYFHVASADEFIPDDDGTELQSLAHCHIHALKIIRECLPFVQMDQRRWWIEVADSKGKSMLTVLYPRRPTFGRRWPADTARTYWSDLLMTLPSDVSSR